MTGVSPDGGMVERGLSVTDAALVLRQLQEAGAVLVLQPDGRVRFEASVTLLVCWPRRGGVRTVLQPEYWISHAGGAGSGFCPGSVSYPQEARARIVRIS